MVDSKESARRLPQFVCPVSRRPALFDDLVPDRITPRRLKRMPSHGDCPSACSDSQPSTDEWTSSGDCSGASSLTEQSTLSLPKLASPPCRTNAHAHMVQNHTERILLPDCCASCGRTLMAMGPLLDTADSAWPDLCQRSLSLISGLCYMCRAAENPMQPD